MHNTKTIWATLGVALGASALVAAIAVTNGVWGDAPVPTKATFDILSQPMDAKSRAAIDSYKGDAEIEYLATSRLLGTDDDGTHYLLATSGDQICMIIMETDGSTGGGCNQATDVATLSGLWLKSVTETSTKLTVLIPDEYNDSKISANGETLLRTKNLVVVASDKEKVDLVKLDSPRYRDLEISTEALPK